MQQKPQRSIFCQGQDDWWWLILKWCNTESEASQTQWESHSGSLQKEGETLYELLYLPQKNLIRNNPSDFNSFDQIPKKEEGLKYYAKAITKSWREYNHSPCEYYELKYSTQTDHHPQGLACLCLGGEPKNTILTHTSSRVPSFSPRKLEAGATIKGIDCTPEN